VRGVTSFFILLREIFEIVGSSVSISTESFFVSSIVSIVSFCSGLSSLFTIEEVVLSSCPFFSSGFEVDIVSS